jgi:hypothetical protein
MFPKAFKGVVYLKFNSGGVGLSEVRIGEVPIPLVNYVFLIKYRRSPYYDIVQHLLREMEIHYERIGEGSEVIYTINPRMLQEEIEKRVKSEKVTTVNICRTILALLYGCKLREGEDFYVTTTSGGRRNYHIKVNSRTLSLMRSFL